MATAPASTVPLASPAGSPSQRLAPSENVWRAPLLPAAIAATVGIVADRYLSIPAPVSLLVLLVCLAAWAIHRAAARGLSLAYLLAGVAALGAAYHHSYRDLSAPDDVSRFATTEPHLARLRGVLAEEPFIARRAPSDPLRSMPAASPTFGALEVTGYQGADAWLSVRGRVRLIIDQPLESVHVGDSVEVTGRLVSPPSAPPTRANRMIASRCKISESGRAFSSATPPTRSSHPSRGRGR